MFKPLFSFYSLIVIFKLLISNASATTYHFANSGSDLNAGTTSSAPWQTIDKLNTIAILPGDSILFLSANIFHGQINVLNGGIENDIIYYGTYGGVDPAIISGAQQVLNWTIYSGNIYQAELTSQATHLFANDKQMTIARYPNSDYLFHQEGIGNTGFVDTSLIQPDGYWNGAMVRMRTSNRRWEFVPVNQFSGDSILFSGFTNNAIPWGFGYYFDNLLSILDTANEWYYDTISNKIFFNAPENVDPNTLTVEVSAHDFGMLLQNGSSYINIDNLVLEKQKGTGIYSNASCTFISIQNCNIRMQGETGIGSDGGCNSCAFVDNKFNDINGIALSLYNSPSCEISNNEFKRIGLISGYGSASVNNLMAIELSASDSMTINKNTVDSIGGCGIFLGVSNSLISENLISNCLLNISDFGSIFLFGLGGNTCHLQHNFILHTIGSLSATSYSTPLIAVGIYADVNSTGNTLEDNTIAYATNGILFSGGSSFNSLGRNVIYGCTTSQLEFVEGSSEGSTLNNIVVGNTFYALHEDADIVKITTPFQSINLAFLDSNYYFNPYDFYAFHVQLIDSYLSTNSYYTLSQWQEKYGQDLSSKATFFFRNRYIIDSVLSDNLVLNGTFANNYDGWSNAQPDNIMLLLDNSTPLDFGCMKLLITDDNAEGGAVYYNSIPLDYSAYYEIGFSCYSVKIGNINLVQIDPVNYSVEDFDRFFPFYNFRQDYQTVFQYNHSAPSSRFYFNLYSADSVVWLDNILLRAVDVSYEDPTHKSRLFINTTADVVTISLGDSIFFDLNENQVTSQITLPPYSSQILIFDSSIISGTPSYQEITASSSIIIYPTIIKKGGIFYLVTSAELNKECTVEIYDLYGKNIETNKFKNILPSSGLQLPSSMIPGIYFIVVTIGNKSHTTKMVVTD